MDSRAAARLLGGEPLGRHDVLCPGPQHGAADRSLHVTLAGGDEFRVHSYAGDDWAACRDHVKARLGLSRDLQARSRPVDRAARPAGPDPDDAERTKRALELWNAARDPRGTIVEAYLRTRALDLPDGAEAWIRFHAACPWRDGGETLRVPAAIPLFRDVLTNEPRAVHRVRLTPKGEKVARMMLGPVGGAAIKVDGDEDVTMGLTIGEGAETCLAARQLGLRPVWALGSAGAIGAFPVLPGVEALAALEEFDDAGANARAIEACASRWRAAGREVLIISPLRGGDVNDALRAGRAG